MRNPYYCPYCDHRSTRRWNLDVHIKRKHGELDRSSDRYMANNPSMYNKNVGHMTVADSNTFHPTFLPQQAVLGTSQYTINPNHLPVDVSQIFANPMYPPVQITDDQSYGTGLSPETILEITELKRLVNKYPQFHTIDADEIVKWAIYCSSNRDNKFLDDMLQQLRTIDSLAKY